MISALIQQVRDQGLYRKRTNFENVSSKANFCSNDYLSLAYDKELRNAFQRGFERYPSGSTASIAVSGYFSIHHELEQAFASFLNTEAGLVFSSGFAANLAVVNLVSQLNTHFIIDKAIHASFYEGIKQNNIKLIRFRHNCFQDLETKLAKTNPKSFILAVEGIFSMSGQQPDLNQLSRLCQNKDQVIIVDEAHSFGVIGPDGAGLTAQYNLSDKKVPLRVIPFGKALGAQGAIVVGPKEWIDALFQFGRSSIYSTGLSPAITYGVLHGLDMLRKASEKRQILQELILYFREKIKQSSFSWGASKTAIQQLLIGCPHKALALSQKLFGQGILCLAMRQPTVTKKDTGLRVVLNAHHSQEDIDHLFSVLESLGNSLED